VLTIASPKEPEAVVYSGDWSTLIWFLKFDVIPFDPKTLTSYGSPEPGKLDLAITAVIWVALFTVTESKLISVPELLTKTALAPVKFAPVIVNVWLPVPSPDNAFVGETEDIVIAWVPTLLARIFLRAPALVS